MTEARREFTRRSERIEELVRRLEACGDLTLRAVAQELLQAVIELHGVALERILDHVAELPQCVRALSDFSLSDFEWAELSLPIQLAYFYRNADGRLVSSYPSPAGAIESELSFESLQEVIDRRAELCNMETLVEALLVSRVGNEQRYFIAPIDECYRLVGLIRTKWRGLSGGTEVLGAVAGFFRELQARAGRERHA